MAAPSLPPLVMGGAGFSYQLHQDPESLPIRDIVLRAFALGVRTIDTSPYYEPSEQLLGAALAHPDVTSKYARDEFVLMTKVGRLTEHTFNYSPAWVRQSVARSLKRFQTTYLDVVFCHDVEFVTREEAIAAVGVLFELQKAGVVRRVGISGHDMRALARVASLVRLRYGRPVDVIQTWAQLTLQNTLAEQWGFDLFRAAGVNTVFCSSPLAVGLLRNGGIPVGRTGDWHPAPPGLRAAVQQAAQWVEGDKARGDTLASVALQYAVAKAMQNCRDGFTVTTITGTSTMSELEENVATAKKVLKVREGVSVTGSPTLDKYTELDKEALARDQPLFDGVRAILGEWVDFDLSGTRPPELNAVAKTDIHSSL
ncbi:hypothetical protein SCUCBS95973_001801 [Sporothrix curviconia]|uniref:NADP-dependent oxidoreductase domain-containing protein n=1 Tax=Sporothrix curviconia TaxID=1260050 RepID=A0ABP0B1M0_9PEZI